MRDHAHELIATAANALAGKAHSVQEMHDALYQLARDIVSPARIDSRFPARRMPCANEVLPRNQRASWARELTAYDVADDEAPQVVAFLHARNRRLRGLSE